MDSKKTQFLRYVPLIAVALSALVMSMLVVSNPTGNYPLNDDWSYARVAKTLIDEHRLSVTPWTLSASITPELLGAIVGAVFGLSFDTLRGLTQALAVVAIFAVGYILKKLGTSPAVTLICLATLLVNPLFFNLSNTFMTDIPGLGLLLCTCCFFLRYLQHKRYSDLIVATALSCSVVLTRQVLVIAPIAFLLTVVFSNIHEKNRELPNERELSRDLADDEGRLSKPLPAFLAALPLVASLACIGVHHLWLLHFGALPFCYTVEQAYLAKQMSQGVLIVLLHFSMLNLSALVYLGLFLLPSSLACFPAFLLKQSPREKGFLTLLALELGVLLSAGFMLKHIYMPLVDNLIFDFGLGPILLPGPKPQTGPLIFWQISTILGSLGAGLLDSYMVGALRFLAGLGKKLNWLLADRFAIFTTLFFIQYMCVICFRGFFDRYLVAAIPFLLFMIVVLAKPQASEATVTGEQNANLEDSVGELRGETGSEPSEGADSVPKASYGGVWKRLSASLAVLSCVALGAFSALGVHDYFSMNRARWKAYEFLREKERAKIDDIDAGMEINDWLFSDPKN